MSEGSEKVEEVGKVEKRKTNIYRHYKGGLYLMMCKAYNVHTQTNMVIYQSLDKGTIFARDEVEFLGEVVVDGITQKRFTQMG